MIFQIHIPTENDLMGGWSFENDLYIECGLSPKKAQVLEAILKVKEQDSKDGNPTSKWDKCHETVSICEDDHFPILYALLKELSCFIIHPVIGSVPIIVRKIDPVRI
jgi:hypothetical protein